MVHYLHQLEMRTRYRMHNEYARHQCSPSVDNNGPAVRDLLRGCCAAGVLPPLPPGHMSGRVAPPFLRRTVRRDWTSFRNGPDPTQNLDSDKQKCPFFRIRKREKKSYGDKPAVQICS
jgi:hypothetical protein